MKRLIFLLVIACSLIGFQALINCSSPLENVNGDGPDPINPIIIHDTVILVDTLIVTDTLTESDTIFVVDTITTTDTVFVVDTLTNFDTVIVIDTLNNVDTIYVVDTLMYPDTIIVVDTLMYPDTIFVVDTLMYPDTVFVVDTLLYPDTIIVVDTVTYPDTVIVVDTLMYPDTVVIIDTITIVDTIFVDDTTAYKTACEWLTPKQKEIEWLLINREDVYSLEFEMTVGELRPNETLTIDVDGTKYIWDKSVSNLFEIIQTLRENSTIRVYPNVPPAHGHEMEICLSIKRE